MGRRLSVPGAELKWYDLYPQDAPPDAAAVGGAREFVRARAEGLGFEDELGFVILHRVGGAHLLLVSTWRGENECWKTVYVDDGTGFVLLPHGEPHIATFCVWELGAVLHEQQAWTRFLESRRTEVDAVAYLDDVPETPLRV
ncbi:hypothetical protein ACN20G_35045 (plasmid) [Streptomyces sp. BI20]|uniref:hypothetical protein n=1 Tax=Streptomyces sp. BI20 TaxID=3403460 RepID=UPI003C78396E